MSPVILRVKRQRDTELPTYLVLPKRARKSTLPVVDRDKDAVGSNTGVLFRRLENDSSLGTESNSVFLDINEMKNKFELAKTKFGLGSYEYYTVEERTPYLMSSFEVVNGAIDYQSTRGEVSLEELEPLVSDDEAESDWNEDQDSNSESHFRSDYPDEDNCMLLDTEW